MKHLRFLVLIYLFMVTCLYSSAQMTAGEYYGFHYRNDSGDTTGNYAMIFGKQKSTPDFYFLIAKGDYFLKHHPEKALENYSAAKSKLKKSAPDSLFALLNYKIGYLYFFHDNYPEALKYLQKSLQYYGKPKNLLQAKLNIHIGFIHHSLGSDTDAQERYKEALNYFRDKNDLKRVAATQNNIALLYNSRGEYDLAKLYLDSCLSIRLAQNDLHGLGQTYNNIGAVHFSMKNYKKALDLYLLGYEFRIKGNVQQSGLIESQINIGKTYYELKDLRNASYWLEQALAEAKNINHLENQRRAAAVLKNIYYENKEYSKAFATQELYYSLLDSLFGIDKKHAVANLALQHQFETKIRQDSIANAQQRRADKLITAEKEKRSTIVFYVLCGGISFLLIFVFQLYKSNLNRKKTNFIIQSQRDALDQKQREMIDSIQYAKRIQNSLLPGEKTMERTIKRLKKE